jgi:hypothetical protein
MNDPKAIGAALSASFDPSEVKFKPAVVSGNRALALPFVDARTIQDRLDDVLGVAGWQDEYDILPDGSVVCKLRLRLGDEWITKMDVGAPSEQPDEGDRRKAAFSDALKRAAVKFGVGRFLYSLPAQWVDYDTHKRQFVRPPQLPASALPAKPTLPKDDATNGNGQGPSFAQRLAAFDSELARRGLAKAGECVRFVEDAAVRSQLPDRTKWTQAHEGFLLGMAREFERQRKARNGKHERNGQAAPAPC